MLGYPWGDVADLRIWCVAGLSGFAVFISVSGIVLSSVMLAVPVMYEKYDKFNRLARAMKEVRVAFILAGSGTAFSLLIACVPNFRLFGGGALIAMFGSASP